MWASAFAFQQVAAMSAQIACCIVAAVSAQGKHPVGNEQRITHIDVHGKGENEVEHGAYTGQTCQIGQAAFHIGLMTHILYHSSGHNDDEPYRGDEQGQNGWELKGVERWVVIEFHPCFGHKMLHTAVECGCTGNDETQQGGIETTDIVEVNQRETAMTSRADEEEQNEQSNYRRSVQADDPARRRRYHCSKAIHQ